MGAADSTRSGVGVRGSILEALESHAARSGGEAACLAPGRHPLVYRELVNQIGRVADWLRDRGVERGDRIALVVANGPEAATAFLGVAASAACAPLNPVYTEAELEFFLSDLGARMLVVDARLDSPARRVASSLGIAVAELIVPFDGPAGVFELVGAEVSLPRRAAQPAAMQEEALVLHTSGTTARPKLVSLTHANLAASAASIASSLDLTHRDRCLNVMPLFHVHGLVGAALASFWAGGSVACTPGFDSLRFFELLDEQDPTWYTAVPTMHQAILARAAVRGAASKGSTLRFARSASAALPIRVSEGLEAALEVPVLEAYGMTEASHQIACNPPPPAQRKAGSVGLPTSVDVAVLDPEGGPLPAGESGEVVIRGPSVFAGYVDDPEANATAFVGTWFRTGDLGHLDEDGYLFLSGRSKEVINRGGEKISPREVDEALLAHPAVAEAYAFAIPDTRLGEEVGAAVVLDGRAAVTAAELQQFVAGRLAEFKVPRLVEIVDALPRGPTGKVQRLALAELLGIDGTDAGADLGDADERPRTAREQRLAALLEEILELPAGTVGRHDNFFALGGDSLRAAQLVAELAGNGPDIPAGILAWAPTVQGLAAWLESERAIPSSLAVAIQPAGTRPPFFLVHGLDADVLAFAPLAQPLGTDQPFYGLRSPDLDRTDLLHDPIGGLAVEYLDAIRAVQPAGPYYLGGYCHGSLVALELAKRLIGTGETVALLALLDPRRPFGELPLLERMALLIVRVRNRRSIRLALFMMVRRRRPEQRRRRRFARAVSRAARRYVASDYAGEITVIWTLPGSPPRRFWEGVGTALQLRRLRLPWGLFRPFNTERLGDELAGILRSSQVRTRKHENPGRN